MKQLSQYFRAGVGAIIINELGHVLAFERSDIPGAWQFPQGGLEVDEEPSEAIFREINEETGISREMLKLVDKYPEPLVYELPPEARSRKAGRGQVQYWFLFKFNGNDRDIILTSSDEFNAWRWMPFSDMIECIVDFRTRVYLRLSDYFSGHLSP